jgi:two-component system, NarL family, response regulator DesR
VIRTLLAHRGALIRGALAFLLDQQEDIEVIGELEHAFEVVPSVLANRPDVVVLDLDLLGMDALPVACGLHDEKHRCGVLILAERRRSGVLRKVVAREAPRGVGFMVKDGPPSRLVDAVRRVAAGDPYLDAELVVAALHDRNPLTQREVEVLSLAAQGGTVHEIAGKLVLSPGTVRNHVSRILAKTGARTRIEAVRIATDAGWI